MATKTAGKAVKRVFGLLIIAGISSAAAADEQFDGTAIRFGIGFALLASEQCEGLSTGPQFDQMISMLETGARVGGKTFDKEAFFTRTKQEAEAKLAGKDICSEARKVTRPGGIVVRK